jgi:bis(5'-nucleosyl)-tetraphosphatase (symmetrical)
MNCLTRLRFCRLDGTLALGYKGRVDQAPPDVLPWFRVPTRRTRNLRIVCGHWSALGYHDEAGVLSIDTGCVWGDKLCAVRLDVQSQPVYVGCSSSGLSLTETD